MRRYLCLLLALAAACGGALADTWRPGLVYARLNGATVALTARFNTTRKQVTLGNGRDACLPVYSAGVLVVPAAARYGQEAYAVTGVARFGFRLCSLLTSVTFSGNLQTVGDFAFVGCNALQSVDLPATVTRLGSGAFAGLGSLRQFTLRNATPSTWAYADVFRYAGIDARHKIAATLVVPGAGYAAYRAATYAGTPSWTGTFASIEGLWDPGDVNMDGTVNASDVSTLVALILGQSPDPCNQAACDLNADGTINSADVSALATLILGNTGN